MAIPRPPHQRRPRRPDGTPADRAAQVVRPITDQAAAAVWIWRSARERVRPTGPLPVPALAKCHDLGTALDTAQARPALVLEQIRTAFTDDGRGPMFERRLARTLRYLRTR